MFQLRKEHMEAFRPVVRAEFPNRLLKAARKDGRQAEREPRSGDLEVTDRSGGVTRVAFYPDGLPRQVTTPTGRTQSFEHDREGRLEATVLPGGERVEFERDQRGNVTAFRRPDLLSYRVEYDERDRPTRIEYPDGSSESYTYHPSGKLASSTDRAGQKTLIQRAPNGRLEAVVDPLGHRTEYVTDAEGRLQAVVFPDGSRQRFAFDRESSKVGTTTRDDKPVFQEIDENGTVRAVTWADGSQNEFRIEAGNLMVAKNAHDELEFSYDRDGNPLSETAGTGKTSYRYDSDGRLLEVTTPWGETIGYEYDGDGRPAVIRDWEGRETKLEYHDHGGISEIHYPNGLVELQTHSRTGRQETVEVFSGRRKISGQRYAYDLEGRLTGFLDAWGEGLVRQHGREFDYDPAGRILREREVGGRREIARFSYDSKGNLTESQGTSLTLGVMDEPKRFGGEPVEYDGAGRMTRLPGKRGDLHCIWGDDGTLRRVEVGGKAIRFAYDALGRRILKTDGTSSTRYIWADRVLLAEEFREWPDAEPRRREYIYYPGVTTPLAFRENGRTFWLQSDVRGAVIRAFDENGNVVWRGSYGSFGALEEESGQIRQPFRLAGQYEDEETGLYYNFARYYSPTLSCYISRDPSWFEPDATNYSYGRNSPWNYSDPWGALAILAAIGIGAVVGAVVGAAVGGIVAAVRGEDPLRGALLGVVDGALVGAGAVFGVPGLVAGAFLGGAASELTRQAYDGDPLCLECAFVSGVIGAGTALILGPVGKWALGRTLQSSVGQSIMRSSVMQRLGKTAVGRQVMRAWVKPRGQVIQVDPRDLRWSQTSAGGRGRAASIRESMKKNGWKGDPIDAVQTKDGIVTVDHTRPAVAREQGLDRIPVRVHHPNDPLPSEMLTRKWNRFGDTAETWGQAVELRGKGQIPPIGSTGTSRPPKLPD